MMKEIYNGSGAHPASCPSCTTES